MSATNRGAERRADDFYATPGWVTRAIIPHLKERDLLNGRSQILEPAAGDGAIIRELCTVGVFDGRISRYEIDPERAKQCGAVCADFLSVVLPPHVGFDLVITNPPYALAFDFAKRALELVKPGGALVMLTRLNWLASVKRASWLRANTPSAHVLPKRPEFVMSVKCDRVPSPREKKKGAEGCTYAVFLPVESERPKVCPLCGCEDLSISTSDASDYAWLVWGKPWSPHHRQTPIVRILEVPDDAR